jgi:hypothetical protein
MGPIGLPELIMISLVLGILAITLVIPFWFICKKAGLPPWLSLIAIVPLGQFVLPIVLAFIEWPALRERRSNQEQR